MDLSMPPVTGKLRALPGKLSPNSGSISMPAARRIWSNSSNVSTTSTAVPSYSSFFATQGPMKTTFASGMRRLMSIACAIMGETTGARYLRRSGKCFSTSRLSEAQAEVIIISCCCSRRSRSYSRLTIVAPIAVSSASEKPSCTRAFLTEFIPHLSQQA